MFRLSRLSFLSLALAGALAAAACTPRVSTSGGQTPAPDPTPANPVPVDQPVTIALLAPQSAANPGAAALGKALVNAARMSAVDVGNPMLNLKVYDTGGDPGKAAAVAQQAIADGAKLIVGPLFGTATKAVAGPATAAGVKVISFSTDATAAGDPVYLSGFLPEMEARRITTFARARGYNSIALFYPQTAVGSAAQRGIRAAGSGVVVNETPYERTAEGIKTGAAAFATAAKAAGATAILLPEQGQGLQFVGALMQNGGLDPSAVKYLGLGGWNARATLSENALRGGWFTAPEPALMKNFVTKYQGSFGAVPPPLAVLGYDAVQIAGQLLAEARATRSNDPFSTRALTRPQGFRGAVGPVRFGPNGLGERGLAVLEVSRGVFQTIDPAPGAFGAGS